jgi:hypothetical protein
VVDGSQDPLAAVASVAVSELSRLMGPGRRAGGYRRPPDRTRFEEDLHLDSRITARVQNLPADQPVYPAHPNLAVMGLKLLLWLV